MTTKQFFFVFLGAKAANFAGHLTACAAFAADMLFFIPNAVAADARFLDVLIAALGGLFAFTAAQYCFIVTRLLAEYLIAPSEDGVCPTDEYPFMLASIPYTMAGIGTAVCLFLTAHASLSTSYRFTDFAIPALLLGVYTLWSYARVKKAVASAAAASEAEGTY